MLSQGEDESAIRRAATSLADNRALPAIKTAAQHLADAGVQEPQAAIAGCIVSLSAGASADRF